MCAGEGWPREVAAKLARLAGLGQLAGRMDCNDTMQKTPTSPPNTLPTNPAALKADSGVGGVVVLGWGGGCCCCYWGGGVVVLWGGWVVVLRGEVPWKPRHPKPSIPSNPEAPKAGLTLNPSVLPSSWAPPHWRWQSTLSGKVYDIRTLVSMLALLGTQMTIYC